MASLVEIVCAHLRCMLISNLAVDQRFANGTQGRLLQWHPGSTTCTRKALPAYCPDLLARFCKETSLPKQEMVPDLGNCLFRKEIFLCHSTTVNDARLHGHCGPSGEPGRAW